MNDDILYLALCSAAAETLGNDLLLMDITKRPDRSPDALFGLLHIIGVPQSEVAKMVDLTRGRIQHYDSGYAEIPPSRQALFLGALKMVVSESEYLLAEWEAEEKTDPSPILAFQPLGAKVLRAKLTACRTILKNAKAKK